MTEEESREKLARGMAAKMLPLMRDGRTLKGEPFVTIHDEPAFRVFLAAVFLEIINCERERDS
jgi:hypothetical protein